MPEPSRARRISPNDDLSRDPDAGQHEPTSSRPRRRSSVPKHIICPECRQLMENLGNIAGTVYLTHPASWAEVHVCRLCKTRASVTVQAPSPPDHGAIRAYKVVEPVEVPATDLGYAPLVELRALRVEIEARLQSIERELRLTVKRS